MADAERPQRFILASRPTGEPSPENFRLEIFPAPAAPPEGVLLRGLRLSLDPYMRVWMDDRKSYAPTRRLGRGDGG